jgi:hypothetical protein
MRFTWKLLEMDKLKSIYPFSSLKVLLSKQWRNKQYDSWITWNCYGISDRVKEHCWLLWEGIPFVKRLVNIDCGLVSKDDGIEEQNGIWVFN